MNHRLTPSSRRYRMTSMELEQECADRIIAYWADRGFDVEVKVETGGFSKVLRAPLLGLRSDMVNGLPTREQAK